MSRENVEVVRASHEAFERGDLEGILVLADPEVVTFTAPPLPDPAEYHGHDGLRNWIESWVGAFADLEQQVESYVPAGDSVVVRVKHRGTGLSSGVTVEAHFWFVHTLRGGRIVRLGVFASEADALEAAGLSE